MSAISISAKGLNNYISTDELLDKNFGTKKDLLVSIVFINKKLITFYGSATISHNQNTNDCDCKNLIPK
jgi:hypothetical protein